MFLVTQPMMEQRAPGNGGRTTINEHIYILFYIPKNISKHTNETPKQNRKQTKTRVSKAFPVYILWNTGREKTVRWLPWPDISFIKTTLLAVKLQHTKYQHDGSYFPFITKNHIHHCRSCTSILVSLCTQQTTQRLSVRPLREESSKTPQLIAQQSRQNTNASWNVSTTTPRWHITFLALP